MRLLLDTHALLWWLLDDPALGRTAYAAIADGGNRVLVSAASAFEVTTKVRIGKLPQAVPLAADFRRRCEDEGFDFLPITIEHADLAGSLAIDHKDPFDRLLIAQSQIEAMPLVSNEVRFDGYGVRRLW